MSIPPLGNDYWRVASYGYPSPFGTARAKEAWAKFQVFATASSYIALKGDLFDATGLSSHAAESWKSAFEKFGLLYVLAGSNKVVLTPAGAQLLDAGNAGDHRQFAWIGLNTLFRVPVGGWRRIGAGSVASNVLGYRLVHAAILDLGDRLWFEELQILTHVTDVSQMGLALGKIRSLRADPSLVEPQLTGDAYNLTRQVAVHASLNYLALTESSMANPYGRTTKALVLGSTWREMVLAALSANAETDACSSGGAFVPRVPAAPATFANEEAYFDFVGAPVSLVGATPAAPLTASIGGEAVRVLDVGTVVDRLSPEHVLGPIAQLCSLARGDRVILTDNQDVTYKVEDKHQIDATTVRITVRTAKPILDYGVVLAVLGETENNDTAG